MPPPPICNPGGRKPPEHTGCNAPLPMRSYNKSPDHEATALFELRTTDPTRVLFGVFRRRPAPSLKPRSVTISVTSSSELNSPAEPRLRHQ